MNGRNGRHTQEIYCGNNLYEIGNRRIGAIYECLKKGIGRGLNSDITGFNPNYQAIISDNTYCGIGDPPEGKVLGTPTSCMRKGFGIGRRIQYDRTTHRRPPMQPHVQPRVPPMPPVLPVQPHVPPHVPPHHERDVTPPRIISSRTCISFLYKWWPIILAVFIGVIAAIFRVKYINIVISMIGVLLIGWFIQATIFT
jgi:hypothetical protein